MRQAREENQSRFLSVKFTGVIKSGRFKYDSTLCLSYVITAGEIWSQEEGKESGISQKSSAIEDKIVWNMPFSVKYETKQIVGWPQLIVVLYGSDYWGRSVVRGYGNVHLPRTDGIHERKIRLFKPIQSTSIWSCLNCCGATYPQFKEPQKVLSLGKGRQHTKVQYLGQIQIGVQVIRGNFHKFGYE